MSEIVETTAPYRYSSSAGSFYPKDISYTSIPTDAIDVTQAQFEAAMSRGPNDTLSIIGGAVTVVPDAGPVLAEARAMQVESLAAAYANAIAQPVSYTTKAGTAKTFQADAASVANLQNTILGLQPAAATPAGFYWVAADNTQVPFTYADLQGLGAAMFAQGWAAFQHLQTQKAAVNAATTAAAAEAIAW